MTKKTVDNLNRKAAEFMGLYIEEHNGTVYVHPGFIGDEEYTPFTAYLKTAEHIKHVVKFAPEHNRNHAQLLLDKVAEEGRVSVFIGFLFREIFPDAVPIEAHNIYFLVLTASPRQITEAFCRTMEVRE